MLSELPECKLASLHWLPLFLLGWQQVSFDIQYQAVRGTFFSRSVYRRIIISLNLTLAEKERIIPQFEYLFTEKVSNTLLL